MDHIEAQQTMENVKAQLSKQIEQLVSEKALLLQENDKLKDELNQSQPPKPASEGWDDNEGSIDLNSLEANPEPVPQPVLSKQDSEEEFTRMTSALTPSQLTHLLDLLGSSAPDKLKGFSTFDIEIKIKTKNPISEMDQYLLNN